MAQRRLFEYLADDKTFDINTSDVAISPKGVYAGFDNAVIKARYDPSGSGAVIGFYLEISHADAAIRMNNADATLLQEFGVIISSQGNKIIEDGSIEIDITTFPSTGYRYDVVICEHEYTPVQGGSQAIYSIIEGIENTNTIPSVPTVLNKIILGILKVYAQGTSEWVRSESPQFANSDIRATPSRLSAMWSNAYPTNVFKPIAGFLDIPKIGNIFNVASAVLLSGTFDKSIGMLPNFGGELGVDKVSGTVIRLFASEDIKILDKNSLDDFLYTPTKYQKPIRTSTGSDVLVRAGGFVTLVENLDNWAIVGVSDYEKNSFELASQLKNKPLWGLDKPFQSAVRQAISQINIKKSIADNDVIVNSDGMIEIPQLNILDLKSQRNIYSVNVAAGQYIVGLERTFEVGSEVTLFFKGANGVVKLNRTGVADMQLFISSQRLDFEAKDGDFIRGVQLQDGFYITEGVAYETWVSPILPQSVGFYASNGTFKYKICENGTIQFDGAVSLQPSAVDVVLFSLPRTLFEFDAWQISKRVAIPSMDDFDGKLTQMIYFIEGNFVKFIISSDTNSESFNFNGLQIPYR
jgi:hypothetical protein